MAPFEVTGTALNLARRRRNQITQIYNLRGTPTNARLIVYQTLSTSTDASCCND